MSENSEIGMKCIKYMIFITNFIFLMVGFLLISIGSTISTVYGDFELFMESHHFQPAYLLIAIGTIIFFVALFGCCGTFKQSVLLINIYVFLLLILLILEVCGVIAAFSIGSGLYDSIETNMLDSMKDYSTNQYAGGSWDFLQERLHCCGVHHMYDWWNKNVTDSDAIKISLGDGEKLIVPRSCSDYFSSDLIIYENGCLDRVYAIINDGAMLTGIAGLCVVFVQTILAVFAYILGRIVRRIKSLEEMHRQQTRQRIFQQLVSQRSEKPAPYPLKSNVEGSSEA